MGANPLIDLKNLGVSVWFDYLSRDHINSGKLKSLVDEDGLSGVTSNPTIFMKAITGSTEYDEPLRDMIKKGQNDPKELFLGLALRDIADAADILWPVYQQSSGRNGFISIEVSPDLAYDTDATVKEARRLFSTIGKKNILVKVPATKEGLPAIEELISEGVNVNVTLLFSIKRYEEVMEAYIKGLERRLGNGLPVGEVSSVASFFVSRVDTLADKLLDGKLSNAGSEAEKERIKGLMGKAAVANAKLAYRKYREVFSGERFSTLKEKGAHIQCLLWGSTGTKNPSYSNIKYVEEIIGPDIINTMPEKTMKAFKDHGNARATIEEGLDEAEAVFRDLGSLGIDMDQVTQQLEDEGVKLFSDSFFSLLKEIAEKRDAFLSEKVA
jgi:transaldolase/glucose-6-phosphate isomerase